MKFRDFYKMILENQNSTISLEQYYEQDFPEENERIWNYVGLQDFHIQLPIKRLNFEQIFSLFEFTYNINTKKELLNLLTKDQLKIVKQYQKDNTLKDQIIILSGRMIVDGNHRALAAYLSQSSIKQYS